MSFSILRSTILQLKRSFRTFKSSEIRAAWTLHQSFSSSNEEFIPVKSVADSLNDVYLGQKISLNGWIKSARIQKVNTFLDVVDGLSNSRLQVVIPTENLTENVFRHSAVSVAGTLIKSSFKGQVYEMVGEKLNIITPISGAHFDPEIKDESGPYPFAIKKTLDDDVTRVHPEFRAKLTDFSSLLRVRSALTHEINQYFRKENFIQIQTPILTSNDCEGAGEVFTVLPANDEIIKAMRKDDHQSDKTVYFDQNVYLTVSGQLHLEAICNGIAKVYTFNQVFRAEKGRSRRHLSEFSMVEAEIAFVNDISTISQTIEDLLKVTLSKVLNTNLQDIIEYRKDRLSHQTQYREKNINLDVVKIAIEKQFVTLSYNEAIDILCKNSEKFNSKPRPGASLGKEHEIFLVENYCGNVPVFIVDWPVESKPFYARKLTEDKVAAVDLLFPYVGELCGGSLREHRPDVLIESLKKHGLDQGPLDWYLDLRRFGAAPTGGFGLGFDRLIQFLLHVKNIRDSVPFARAPHLCRL